MKFEEIINNQYKITTKKELQKVHRIKLKKLFNLLDKFLNEYLFISEFKKSTKISNEQNKLKIIYHSIDLILKNYDRVKWKKIS